MLSRFGLSDPGSTKTIRIEGGVPAVTDGPFGEAKEQLAGVFLVDSDTLERVLEYSGSARSVQHRRGAAGHGRDDGRGDVTADVRIEGLLRELAPQALGALGAAVRPVRCLRGRGPGGAAGRGDAVARGGRPGESAWLADHGRLAAG